MDTDVTVYRVNTISVHLIFHKYTLITCEENVTVQWPTGPNLNLLCYLISFLNSIKVKYLPNWFHLPREHCKVSLS